MSSDMSAFSPPQLTRSPSAQLGRQEQSVEVTYGSCDATALSVYPSMLLPNTAIFWETFPHYSSWQFFSQS